MQRAEEARPPSEEVQNRKSRHTRSPGIPHVMNSFQGIEPKNAMLKLKQATAIPRAAKFGLVMAATERGSTESIARIPIRKKNDWRGVSVTPEKQDVAPFANATMPKRKASNTPAQCEALRERIGLVDSKDIPLLRRAICSQMRFGQCIYSRLRGWRIRPGGPLPRCLRLPFPQTEPRRASRASVLWV